MVLITFVLLLLKREMLAYPSGQFEIELLVLLYYIALKYIQMKVASQGNRIESQSLMVVTTVLGAFCVFTNIYFLAWQTYIMWIELVLNIGAAGFTLTEIATGGVAICFFRTVESLQQRQNAH